MGHHHHYDQEKAPLSQTIIQKSSVPTSMDASGEPMVVDSAAGPDLPLLGHVSVQQFKQLEGECMTLRESNQKMKQQLVDSQRRERLMMRRLAAKEQELLDYVNQVAELKAVQTPGQVALKAALLDPAVNLLFQKLKQELQATQARLEETQNELAAWKFTPDSNTGKRLMAKCRLLHQENEELGKLTSNGRLAKLESELAMQKGVSEDLKKSHCDLDEVLLELEEDVEGMQNTILLMQRELKVARQEEASSRVNGAAAKAELSGDGVSGGSEDRMEVTVAPSHDHEDDGHARTRLGGGGGEEAEETAGVRTTPSVAVPVSGAGEESVVSGNNGQSMVTRKRTRSSVAQQQQHNTNSEEATDDQDAEGKRNRYNNNPRTRGQLLVVEERAKEVLSVMEEDEEEAVVVKVNGGSESVGNGGCNEPGPIRSDVAV